MTFTDALAELHRNNCIPGMHDDACLALTAGFDELVVQRDRARRIAVSLEQEVAHLRGADVATPFLHLDVADISRDYAMET